MKKLNWRVLLFVGFISCCVHLAYCADGILLQHKKDLLSLNDNDFGKLDKTNIGNLKNYALTSYSEEVVWRASKGLFVIGSEDSFVALREVLLKRVLSCDIFPATRILSFLSPALKNSNLQFKKRLEAALTGTIYWRDKLLIAGSLSSLGNERMTGYLMRAYMDSGVLLNPEQVRESVIIEICKSPDKKASSFLIKIGKKKKDVTFSLNVISCMMKAKNEQVINVLKSLIRIHSVDFDILCAQTYIECLTRFGKPKDLPLIHAVCKRLKQIDPKNIADLSTNIAKAIKALKKRKP